MAILFAAWSNGLRTDLRIFIGGQHVPTIQDPKILGVTQDQLPTFKQHIRNSREKINANNSILKTSASISWSADKETLLSTFKATSKPVINYCCPICSPSLRDTGTLYRSARTAPFGLSSAARK